MNKYKILSQLVALSCSLFVSGLAFAQPAPAVPSLSGEQIERLNGGEILVSVTVDGAMTSDVIGVLEAPAEQILAIVDDFGSYTEFMPDSAVSEVVGTDGEYRLCHGVTDTPWPVEDREYTLRVTSGPQTVDGMEVLVNTWTYVPDSGNIANTEGYWILVPWGDDGTSTLVRYFTIADMGIPLPEFLVTWASEDMLPGYLEALRGRI